MHALSQAPRPWNIRRRVEQCRAHQGRFHSPHRFSEVRVRRKGPGAHGPGRTGRTGAERRKCGSGCRDRQESASWGRCGSGARLSDGNRKGREMVARDEQKRMAGRVAWRDDVGNGNEPSQRGTDGRRKGQTGDQRTANKRGEVWTNQKRGRLSISRPRIKDVEVFSKRQKQVAADLAKIFVERFLLTITYFVISTVRRYILPDSTAESDAMVLTLESTPWSVSTLTVRVSADLIGNLSAVYPIIHAVTVPSEAGANPPSLVMILS